MASRDKREQDNEEWLPIFHSSNPVEWLAVQDALEAEGIECVPVDQRDRLYPMLGQTVLLVALHDEARALQIVKACEENEQSGETDA